MDRGVLLGISPLFGAFSSAAPELSIVRRAGLVV